MKSNERSELVANYKIKNRRVKITTRIYSDIGKVYIVKTKRLDDKKNIVKVKTVYTQESLDFVLHCLNDFTEQEVSRAREHNAHDLIEALKQERNVT